MKVLQEKALFLYKFLGAPRQIGSVTPSSIYLADKMIESIPWHEVRHIAELGAGTGAITKRLAQAHGDGVSVLLFEQDAYLRIQLADRFPEYKCYADAGKLLLALKSERIEALDCIVSGLPFFNFPKHMRDHLLNEIVQALKPGGLFVAFQYSLQMRKPLSACFEIERIHFVPWNLPPAFVYVCRKRGDQDE